MYNLFEKLKEVINKYDNFIIMGHKDPDLDCLGASLGLCEIIESFGKKAYIFLNNKNLQNYNSNINQAFERMQKDIICVTTHNYKKIINNTLLIVVDVHSSDRLEYPKLVDLVDTVVIDHHIKNKNYIKTAKFMYIDSNISSVSEIITYFAKYLNVNLDGVISTILLGGIEIDTNGFNLKTTNFTYEAASILMEMGADSILKQELLKESKSQYIKRASYIKNSFIVKKNIAMCVISKITNTIELAEIAEELLTFEDVEASFVIGKLDQNTVGVSARSLGVIDVSDIMKQLGGGGHTSNAATQIKNKTINEIKENIIKLL